MKAFVFCAGYGTRMAPLTDKCAKPAMPFFGKPLIAHTLKWLNEHGVTKVIINLHHLPKTVRAAATANAPSGMVISYSQESEILGTGGGLAAASTFFEPNERFVTVNGDIFTEINLSQAIAQHDQSPSEATLVLNDSPENSALFGVGVTSTMTITDFWGIPEGSMTADRYCAFTGVAVLTEPLLQTLPTDGFACVKERGYIPALSRGSRLNGAVLNSHWFDLGTPARYLNAHRKMMPNAGQLSGYPERLPMVWSADPVPNQVKLVPPVVIGPNLIAHESVTIGPNAVIGSAVRVLEGANLSNAVVWDNTTVVNESMECILAGSDKVCAKQAL